MLSGESLWIRNQVENMQQSDKDQKMFLAEVRKTASEKVAPSVAEIDKSGELPWDLKQVFQGR
jgi:hypothetical protein